MGSMIDSNNANLRGGPSHSAISKVQNLSIGNATFKVTQSQTVIQNQRPVDDLQSILDWLSPINYRVIQNDTFSKHTVGTGSWFIEHPKFQGWVSGRIPVLCAIGPPGVGNTILSSIIIRHLESSISNNRDHTAIVFAYCRYTGQLSITDILASFVKQLVERHPHALYPTESIYRKHRMDATRPIIQDWLELLHPSIQSFKHVYIVVDAIDEFPDDTRDGLLNALISLRASLLITSRPSNTFHLVRDVEFIEIGDENGPGQDIKFFIQQKFKESSNLSSILKGREQVRREIYTKLRETLAALQIESLKNSTTVSQLRKAANALSSDMDAIYSASWERIKAQPKPQALLAEAAIIWLIHAFRPLTITELQHALAVPSDGEAFDTEDVPDEDTIVSVSCGLITIEREGRIVRLVHFTALDFFNRIGQDLCSKPHRLLSTRCLSYLSAAKFSPNKISTREELEAFLKEGAHPFRGYAYHYWGLHAARCHEEDGMPKAVTEFLRHCEHYPCIVDGGKFDLFKRCHVAVYYGIRDKSVLSNDWQNQSTLLTKSTPLILACARGNVDAVELILSHGSVNLNAQNVDGATALMLASGNGSVAVVKLLTAAKESNIADRKEVLDHCANVSCIDNANTCENTAVSHAAEACCHKIVGLLLSQPEVDINLKNRAATILALSKGHMEIVRLLVNHRGVDLNLYSNSHSVLTIASEYGHMEVVQLLLSRSDLNVNLRIPTGDTALIFASLKGHVDVVRLLLDHGADFNAQSNCRHSALTIASEYGHTEVVRLLLSRPDLHVNVRTFTGDTALILASSKGQVDVVRQLVDHHGVDLNVQSTCRHTALTMAAEYGHTEVVRILLNQPNLNVNLKTFTGDTALILASSRGRVDVVRQLIGHRVVDLNVQSNFHHTALTMASEYGHTEVVQVLLNQPGLDISLRTKAGETALMLASLNGHVEIVSKIVSCHRRSS